MQIGLNEKESKKIDDNFESKDLSEQKKGKIFDLNYYKQNNIELINGFIHIQIESKTLNIALTKIKKFLKNKGYHTIKRNLNEIELVVSNGEIDVLLKIEKYKRDYAKLNYFRLQGNRHHFELFKKEIQSLKTVSL